MKCSVCNKENRTPRFKACLKCRKKHRIRNQRHHKAHRDEISARAAMKNREARKRLIAEGFVTLEMASQARDAAVVEIAEHLGRIPTSTELRDFLDIPNGSAAYVRRRVFNLRPSKSGGPQPHIPYPVPKEYLAVGKEWEQAGRRK